MSLLRVIEDKEGSSGKSLLQCIDILNSILNVCTFH
jgi:hypothetical protein